jgi:hypothetical protein
MSSLHKKYQNVHLNNQYIFYSQSSLPCPICEESCLPSFHEANKWDDERIRFHCPQCNDFDITYWTRLDPAIELICQNISFYYIDRSGTTRIAQDGAFVHYDEFDETYDVLNLSNFSKLLKYIELIKFYS